MRWLVALVALLVALLVVTVLVAEVTVWGGADKTDWPEINGLLLVDKRDRNNHERGAGACPRLPRVCTLIGTDRDDELLGGHRSNRIFGGSGVDVLWGDHVVEGANSESARRATDEIDGGPGGDFIYGGHGTNLINAGPGGDRIRVHFGRGRVDCGSGRDWYHVARSRRDDYTFISCETVDYRTER